MGRSRSAGLAVLVLVPTVMCASFLGVGVGAARAMAPVQAVRHVMTEGKGELPDSVRCVSKAEIRQRSGMTRAVGVTIRTGSNVAVLLDWKRVCYPLGRYLSAKKVQPYDVVMALGVVFHEMAHVNGIRVEWKAECASIPEVLAQLRRWGFDARQLAGVKRALVDFFDRDRAREYQLRGRCHVDEGG